MYQISARDDLSGTVQSMLGDCMGAGTHYDASRQHISTYTWGHYGDLDTTAEPASPSDPHSENSLVACLDAGLDLLGSPVQAPVLDLGCAVGRTAFELAEKQDSLVLGVDLNFSMLRIAQKVLRGETQNYPLRRVGLVYEHRILDASFARSGQVDFWACDASALPFSSGSFGLASALNVLDSVISPLDLLRSIEESLMPGGGAVIACPYDWTSAVTPLESWIGGHSQRSKTQGASEPMLRSLVTPQAHPLSLNDLELKGEIEHQPWSLRLHDRSQSVYSTHLIAVQKRASH
jgi:SAM-dependent methyltransferase